MEGNRNDTCAIRTQRSFDILIFDRIQSFAVFSGSGLRRAPDLGSFGQWAPAGAAEAGVMATKNLQVVAGDDPEESESLSLRHKPETETASPRPGASRRGHPIARRIILGLAPML